MTTKNIFSTLVFTLSFVSLSTLAFADVFLGGDETTNNRIVNSSVNWTILAAEPIATTKPNTHCVVTGSADAKNPNMGVDNLYRFTLSVDNNNPATGGACERTEEFDLFDEKAEEISSTCTLRNLPAGAHTIFWLARKIGAAPNMTVVDNSFTFVCLDDLMDLDGEGDGGDGG